MKQSSWISVHTKSELGTIIINRTAPGERSPSPPGGRKYYNNSYHYTHNVNYSNNEKKIVDPPRPSDPLQNVMGSKLAHATPLHHVLWNSVWFCEILLSNGWTD